MWEADYSCCTAEATLRGVEELAGNLRVMNGDDEVWTQILRWKFCSWQHSLRRRNFTTGGILEAMWLMRVIFSPQGHKPQPLFCSLLQDSCSCQILLSLGWVSLSLGANLLSLSKPIQCSGYQPLRWVPRTQAPSEWLLWSPAPASFWGGQFKGWGAICSWEVRT